MVAFFGAAEPALAASAPALGTAQSFAVLGGSTVSNTGPSTITGDLGVSPGSAITGFPPGIVNGTIHANDATASGAQTTALTAYNDVSGQACTANLTGQDLGGLTLTPGVYCFNTSSQLTGTLTLDAQGDSNAVFIFKVGSTLTTAVSSTVNVINSGQNCNVFWQVGGGATLGTNTTFKGTVLALTSITLNNGSSLNGRAWARNGAITMDSNTISTAICAAPSPPSAATSIPTLSEWGVIFLSSLMAILGIVQFRRRKSINL